MKLCYDLGMIFRKLSRTVIALLTVSAIAPAWSQLGGDQLASELNNLRQQQRQLERDIDQYEQSIELLRSKDADFHTVDDWQAFLTRPKAGSVDADQDLLASALAHPEGSIVLTEETTVTTYDHTVDSSA